jgi:hypothetical protein
MYAQTQHVVGTDLLPEPRDAVIRQEVPGTDHLNEAYWGRQFASGSSD